MSHLPCPNLSFLTVAVGELGPRGRRQRALARSRPQTRAGELEAPVLARGASPGLAGPVSRVPARPGACSGGGFCFWSGLLAAAGALVREATAHGDKAGRSETACDTTHVAQTATSQLIPFLFPFIKCRC